MTQCTHAVPDPLGTFATCKLGLFGGRPSAGICHACLQYEGPSRGLGDTINRIAKATGIESVVKKVAGESCGCNKRRITLNQFLPY